MDAEDAIASCRFAEVVVRVSRSEGNNYMGKTPVERLEKLRNLRFAFRMKTGRQKKLTLADIEQFCGNTASFTAPSVREKLVSFIGFFNEFDDVYGKNCVYIHLFPQNDQDWLAKRAVNHGALAVVSEYQIENLPCIVVEDVWKVLRELSRFYLRDYTGGRVAIAGSIGKTTTKEMVEAVLAQRFKKFCTPNNGNVLRYLAFEIQHMPRNVEQFIQEVDESYPHNARDCSYVLQPNIAIITTIDNSHVGALGSEEAVEQAILDVTACMPEDGTVIISADDPKSKAAALQRRVVSVGVKDQSADCTATEIVSDGKSVDFVIRFRGESAPIHLNCPGEHNVYNAMFAFVAGKLNGMKTAQIRRGLRKYRPMTVRQNTIRSLGKTLYVDCFNASAKSVGAALRVLQKMKPRGKGRRIAVIGDIAEIGDFETQTYQQIAGDILSCGIDLLVTYGTDSLQIWDNFGSVRPNGIHISDRSALLEYIKKSFCTGDVILFKASGSMHMDQIVRNAFPFAFFLAKLPYRIKSYLWLIQTL